jgi:hypothetical protein
MKSQEKSLHTESDCVLRRVLIATLSVSLGGSVFEDAAVPEPNDAIGRGRDFSAVGDEYQRESMPFVELAEELQDLALALAVEITGRLIGQEETGLICQSTGYRDTLSLAHRKIHGAMVAPMAQANLHDEPLGPIDAFLTAPRTFEHRNLNILGRRQGAKQVKRLEDEANLSRAVPVFIDLRERLAPEIDLALGRTVKPAK